jgi:hypothetical protein
LPVCPSHAAWLRSHAEEDQAVRIIDSLTVYAQIKRQTLSQRRDPAQLASLAGSSSPLSPPVMVWEPESSATCR